MKNYSRKISIGLSIITLLVTFGIMAKDVANTKYYEMDPKKAIAECTDFENAKFSFERARYAPDGELQLRDIKYSFLCGVQQAGTLEANNELAQIFIVDKNFGEAKIIFEHQTEGKFYCFDMLEGENFCILEGGIYNIYVIGKYFSGKLSFTF
ncbi:MAG: hypothetical protein E7488_07650 [Ruminococcaceae bacterium]|nr:hypothetical protein [Oscillospiraceae bacterium]